MKSTRGAIDVFLCPDDIAGVCSPVTGASPSKVEVQPVSTPPRALATATTPSPDPRLASPASTSSTVTAVSQQEAATLVLPADSGPSWKNCVPVVLDFEKHNQCVISISVEAVTIINNKK